MTKGKTGLGWLLATSAMTFAAAGMPAMAQDQTAQASQGGLEDIVVTARKREENVQSIPVAVTAISAALIAKQDLTSIEKIAARTPNLNVGRSSNGSGAQITLRGIGSSASSIGIEQSVAAVVDGVYYGQGRIINEGFFDLARVEILKGPQALFFGKNATAGVISITTADPTARPEFRARASYEFNAQQGQLEFMGSGPLSDTLGVRVALRGSKMWGGYYRNVATPVTYTTLDIANGFAATPHVAAPAVTDQPGEKELIGRITLKWEPTDRLTATFKASGTYNEVNNGSWTYSAYHCPAGMSQLTGYACDGGFVLHQNNIPADIAANFPFAKSDGSLYNRYKSYALTANLVYDLDDVSITSVTNYNWNNNRFACACDFQSSARGTWATENTSYRAFSSELRALTTFDSPVNLMVGGLYQKTKRAFDQFVMFANLEDSSKSAANRYLAFTKDSQTDGETVALFGQATWKLVPQLELAAGARYTHETKDSYFTQPYVNGAFATIFVPGVVTQANQRFNNWSPEVSLTWKPTRDLLVYGAYKTAYKSGGFSNGGIHSALSPNPLTDLSFDPERAAGFEGGIKSTLLDNQLRLNLSLYSYLYKDLQIDFFNSTVFAFQTLTADARTKGAELEFEYAPHAVPGLNLHGSVSYNKSRYTDFPAAPCYAGQRPAEGCNLILNPATGAYRPITGVEVGQRQNLNGQATSVAPEWTGSVGVAYDGTIGSGLTFGVNADLRWSSSYVVSAFGNPDSRQGSYATLDAGVRIGGEDDRWQIALIGKNLTNKFYVSGVVDGPSTGAGRGTAAGVHADQLGYGSVPRTVTLQLTTKF
jgi:iron complex outermembrane receptor protein